MYTRHWEGSSRQPRGLSLGRPRCLFSGTLIVAEWKLLFSACTIAAVAVATSVTSLLGTRLRQGHNVSQRVTTCFDVSRRVTTCHDGSRRVTTCHTRFLSVLRKKKFSLLPRPFQACSASTPCLASAPFAATLAINAAMSSLDAA